MHRFCIASALYREFTAVQVVDVEVDKSHDYNELLITLSLSEPHLVS